MCGRSREFYGWPMADDVEFTGSVPELYDRLLVPMIFAEPAASMARHVASLAPAHTKCGVTECIPSGIGFTLGMTFLLLSIIGLGAPCPDEFAG